MIGNVAVTSFGIAGLLALSAGLNGWTASLEARGGSRVSGSARVEPAGAESIRASLEIRGAPARSQGIAWAIHQGTCEAPGPVHGDPSSYPPLVTDFTGETWEMATLASPLGAEGSYVVVVHRSEDPASPVAACGVLRASGM